jgi:hypothetical protein
MFPVKGEGVRIYLLDGCEQLLSAELHRGPGAARRDDG